MNNQKLIIYEFEELYKILIEINNDVNLIIKKASKNDISDFISQPNTLILTQKKISSLDNQIIFDGFPVPILKLLEKINTQFLKINFNKTSDIMIGSYKFNLNSREMSQSNLKLKLTEKEINSIIYLFNSKDVVKIDELQSKVWGYQPELETHTVETHIYRLRKKILQKFNDENFILTNKSGYEIVKKK
jgi:DNA-binding winged helix-turn-helix (wHTH) protein